MQAKEEFVVFCLLMWLGIRSHAHKININVLAKRTAPHAKWQNFQNPSVIKHMPSSWTYTYRNGNANKTYTAYLYFNTVWLQCLAVKYTVVEWLTDCYADVLTWTPLRSLSLLLKQRQLFWKWPFVLHAHPADKFTLAVSALTAHAQMVESELEPSHGGLLTAWKIRFFTAYFCSQEVSMASHLQLIAPHSVFIQ